jgi:lantibiotic transport system ATP-binding protein
VKVFDQELEKHRVSVLKKIGSLIENPSFYGHLTAFENLKLLQKIYRCPESRMKEVLELVGLASTGSKRLSQFSLGMKQRMGIAIALLNNPALLVLDEPTNGLDPNGMIEIRELLLKLNREQGTTILISSHLLAEIEKLVSHIGVINKGVMLFEGTIDALKEKQRQFSHVCFETSDPGRTALLLKASALEPQLQNESVFLEFTSREQIARINQQLIREGIDLYEVKVVRNDLESIFMNLINN